MCLAALALHWQCLIPTVLDTYWCVQTRCFYYTETDALYKFKPADPITSWMWIDYDRAITSCLSTMLFS